MRTTLRIEDDVLRAAKSIAEMEEKTVGQVISELARKGLRPRPQEEAEMDFPVFSIPADARPITPEMVRRAAEEP
jgi:predicted DNA-binding ribbon-helix-helix protein